MKRGIIVLLLLLVVALVISGWWWARQAPNQVSQFLVEGGLEASRAQQFIDVVSGRKEVEEANVLVASGSVEGESVSIVSEFGGQIVGLYADEGDQVEAGDVLVVLGDSVLQAQMAQAQAAVQAAKANLATGRYRTLENKLDRAIEQESSRLFETGVNAYSRGKYSEAAKYWRQVLELQPNNKRAQENLERADRVIEKLQQLKKKQHSN